MPTDLPLAFDLAQARNLLLRTPATLRALLGDLDDAWLTCDEGEGTWTCADVVAHLADLEETDWIPRLRVILREGDRTPFEPIDRDRFRTALAGMPMPALLDLFAERRQRNVQELESLQLAVEDLERRGRHPDLGTVTLAQLLSTWAVHDLTHLAQIARVMAKRYDSDVGPWRAYLSILSRERLPRG